MLIQNWLQLSKLSQSRSLEKQFAPDGSNEDLNVGSAYRGVSEIREDKGQWEAQNGKSMKLSPA